MAGFAPVGFLVVMLGFGLRLDSTWQRSGLVLIVAGAVVAALGMIGRRRFRPAGSQGIMPDRPAGAVEDTACAPRSS